MTNSPDINSKLPEVGTTIFTVMSKLGTDYGAINLSQGFPSFDCSPELKHLIQFYMEKGENQYAPMSGVPALRQKISEKTQNLYGVRYDATEEVTVTTGATEAIFSAITTVVRPGDEVIIFEPSYDSYAPAVKLAGGVPVYISLDPPFEIDWDLVKQKINPRTRLIVINTPHNPTGKVLSKSDLNALAELVRNSRILLVSDEVYEHIVFEGRTHQSLMMNPELQKRTFVCGSFGKTFHITGWKQGYCLAPKEMSLEFRKIHQFVTFSVVTPIQYALAKFLDQPDHYLQLSAFYQRKRDRFLKAIGPSRFKYFPAEGSFFQMLAYEAISSENDFDLAVRLTKEVGVASIPTSVFYHDRKNHKLLRFCFAKSDSELDAAGAILSKL
ncbi:MAG TPA: methionine aminotransferase [Cyclobacteriaceae bacterium]|nr:methionine aminotransferase [Cyclobacteriaceae bacterium]